MNVAFWRTLVAGAAGLWLLALTGCQGPSLTASEEANKRWNRARSDVKVRLAADQFVAGNVAGASAQLAEAERLTPEDPALVPLRAKILMAEGRTGPTIDLLRRTQLEGRRQAEIEYLTGVAQQQEQHWEEALAGFIRATQLDGQEVAYLVAAVQTCLQLGRSADALSLLDEAAPRLGWTSAYQAALAECCEQLGDWPAAASAWARVTPSESGAADLRLRLALALCRGGQHSEAIPVLLGLLDAPVGPSPTAIRLMLAECYLACGQDRQAHEQVLAALRVEPEHAGALRLLARVLAAMGDHAGAWRAAQQAVSADGRNAGGLELAAALAWRTGNREAAATTARRLLALDSQNPIGQHILSLTSVPASP